MDRNVFIDETGDMGEYGSKYFIITAVWIDNPSIFERLIKNMRRNKFKKQLKNAQEIKANKSSSQLIEHVLLEFSKMETAHAQSIILEKKRLFSEYLKKDKNKLYNFVCGHLSNISIDSKRLIIRVDKSKGRQSLVDDFNHYVNNKFKETRWSRDIEIYHSWSHSWAGLQIADIVSWAVFQRYEHDNDFYLRIIDRKVNVTHMWK